MNPESPKTCRCHHHWVAHTAVILIGVAFLFQALNWLTPTTVSFIWPILLIVWGGSKFCKCC